MHNDNKLTGCVKFFGRLEHHTCTALCKIKNNGLFYAKILLNNNSFYAHSNNTKFRDMLLHHRIMHQSRLEKTIKLINGVPAVCDAPKKGCWICASTNATKENRTQDAIFCNPA